MDSLSQAHNVELSASAPQLDRSEKGQWSHNNARSVSESSTDLRRLGNPDPQNTPYRFDRFPEPLRHPEYSQNPGSLKEGTIISSKQSQYGSDLGFVAAAFVLSNFALYYAYEALVSPRPALGKLFFPPSITIFVINVLSQGVAFLMAHIFASTFEGLRWTFASRRTGVRMATFLGLSRATSLLGVGRLLCVKSPHRFWCLQRLLYPALCSAVAVILTVGIGFRTVYTPGLTIPVLAGLAPMNASLVGLIPSSIMCIYFSTWSYGILAVSKFVTGIVSEECTTDSCLSVFLPGGLEIARLRTGNLNSTLLNGTALDNSPTILINDAPGFQLDFFPIDPSYSFDSDDCNIYGQERGQGLQICLASNNLTLLAGWSVCPSDLYTTGECFSDTSWTSTIEQSTSLNIFKRYSTVAYDRQNLSILSVESISDPEAVEIKPSDLHRVFSYVLTPGNNATSDDTELTNAMLFQIGWVLRLSQDDFPDDKDSPLNFLRGFLTIPIQFSTVAWQFVNATIYASDPQSTLYSLPPDLDTTASATQVTYRVVSTKLWTVYAFMAAVVVLLLWSNSLFGYMISQKTIVPNRSAFSDIDVSSKSTYPPNGVEALRPVCDYSSALRDAGLGNAQSSKIVKGLNEKVVRVVETDGGRPGDKLLLLAVSNTETECLNELEGFSGLTTGVKY